MSVIVQTLTAASTSPWVCPAGVSAIQIELWGGGGKAAGQTANGGGGGAGGGAYTKKLMFPVTPGTSYAFQVGLGSGTAGQAGGNSFWVSSSVLNAAGGLAPGTNNATGASGGAADVTGDVSVAGGNGASGTAGTNGGGGGESGGPNGQGNNGSAALGGTGNANAGDGGAGMSGSVQGPGNAGVIPGGGGGGALRISSGVQLSGSGANGQIGLTYTMSAKWVPIEWAVRLRSLQQGALNVGNTQQNKTNLIALATAQAKAQSNPPWARFSTAANASYKLQVVVALVPGYVRPIAY